MPLCQDSDSLFLYIWVFGLSDQDLENNSNLEDLLDRIRKTNEEIKQKYNNYCQLLILNVMSDNDRRGSSKEAIKNNLNETRVNLNAKFRLVSDLVEKLSSLIKKSKFAHDPIFSYSLLDKTIDLFEKIKSDITKFISLVEQSRSTLKHPDGNTVEIIATKEYFDKILDKVKQVKIGDNLAVIINNLELFQAQTKNMIDSHSLIYKNKFEEDTKLTVQKFESKIQNLIDTFEKKIEQLNLEQYSLKESNSILIGDIDKTLRSLNDLHKRHKNIELEFNSIITIETDKIRHEINDSKQRITQDIDDLIKTATEKTQEIEKTHSDFKNLVENAGIYNLTENYSKKAEEEKEQYITYRAYTTWAIIAAIATTIIVLGIPIFEYWGVSQPINTGYLTILSRLSISVMFFVLALYLSKQAAKHYECYQDNHKTFLQLAALEPFITNMSDEDKLAIRKELIPIYFSQGNDTKYSPKGDEVDFSSNVTSIINKLIDKVDLKKSETEPSKSNSDQPTK